MPKGLVRASTSAVNMQPDPSFPDTLPSDIVRTVPEFGFGMLT
jgi:hypothetical protein